MAAKVCPDASTLEKLLLGDLPAAEREALSEHLQDCPTCVRAAETIAAQDLLTAAMQSRREFTSDETTLAEAIARAKQLRSRAETVGVEETLIAGNLPRPESSGSFSPGEAIEFLSPAELPDEIGRLGEYRVLEVLGAGGMGVVFRAEDRRLERQVALKAMQPAVAANRSAKDRFLREAKATAAIEHDNIVQIYEVGEDRSVPFIAMRFLRGESLQQRLDRETKLDSREVLRIGREIGAGLAAAHSRELIHRDIKPDNVWLEQDSDRVKIVDFGLVRTASDDAGLTQSGTVLGTPRYMAPEQALGQAVDHRCDLFSLGSVLYHLATGKPPFEGGNLTATLIAVCQTEPRPVHEANPDIHPGLARLIMRLLDKDREKRFQSAAEVVRAIEEIEAELTDAAHADTQTLPKIDTTAAQTVSSHAARRKREAPLAAADTKQETDIARSSLVRSPYRGVAMWAGLAGIAVLVASAVAVFAIRTKHGTLTIQADDQVAVQLESNKVLIRDRKTGDSFRLSVGESKMKQGEYEIVVNNPRSGLVFSTREFSIQHGSVTRLKVTFVPVGSAVPKRDKSLDRAATEWALSIGGSVDIEAEGRLLRFVRSLQDLPDQPFQLVAIDVSENAKVKDADLTRLGALKSLNRLYLNGTPITDRGLANLTDSGRKALKVGSLLLNKTAITDTGLQYLARCDRLIMLGIGNTQVSDLGSLKGFKQLGRLEIAGAPVTGESMATLRELRSLWGLFVDGSQIAGERGEHFSALTELTELTVSDLTSDFDASHLDSLRQLQRLFFLRSDASALDKSFWSSVAELPNVDYLRLNTGVNDAALAAMQPLPSLQVLEITGNGISGRAIAVAAAKLPKLTELRVPFSKLTDEDAQHLQSLKRLTRLNLNDNLITPAGIRGLRVSLPACEIVSDHGKFPPSDAAGNRAPAK